MKWSDSGIVISTYAFGEKHLTVNVLTLNQGRHAGLWTPPRKTSKSHSTMQIGTRIHASWQARLEQHLGTYTLEITETPYIHFMSQPKNLAALNSACFLCATLLPERHPYPALYEGLGKLIESLKSPENTPLKAYIEFEFLLLQELGFGFDLTSCAATGQRHDLVYLSPRTGRAVSREAGLPLRDKLFELPPYWLSGQEPRPEELSKALKITGHFIYKNLLQGKDMPHARGMLG